MTDAAAEEAFWDPRRPWRRPVVIVAAAVLVVALAVTAVLVVRHLTARADGPSSDPRRAAEHWLHDLGARDVDAACAMSAELPSPHRPLRKGGREFARCVRSEQAYVRNRSAATLAALRRVTVLRATVPDVGVRGDLGFVQGADIRPRLHPDEFPGVPGRVPVFLANYRGLWYAMPEDA